MLYKVVLTFEPAVPTIVTIQMKAEKQLQLSRGAGSYALLFNMVLCLESAEIPELVNIHENYWAILAMVLLVMEFFCNGNEKIL